MADSRVDPSAMIAEFRLLRRYEEDRLALLAACRCVVENLGAHGGDTPAYIDDEYPSPKVANAFFAVKSVLVLLGEPLVAPSVGD